MAMFKKQIKIYGRHALIMQKYCKDKGGEQDVSFSVSNNDGNINGHFYIFETRIGIYMVSAMLGIINNKQVEEDSDKKVYSSIMVDMLEKQRDNLDRIYHHMILSNASIDSTDAKIKKAFSIISNDEQCDIEQHKLENYVRGGLEIIDDLFEDCKSYEDICNSFLDMLETLKLE